MIDELRYKKIDKITSKVFTLTKGKPLFHLKN